MASKKMRRAGKYARNKGNNSEKYYAERLQKKLGGAQPYSVFAATIESML